MKHYSIAQDYVETHFTTSQYHASLLPAPGLKQGLFLRENLLLPPTFIAAAVIQHCPLYLFGGKISYKCFASAQTHFGALKVVGAWLTDSCGGPWHQAVLMLVEQMEKWWCVFPITETI